VEPGDALAELLEISSHVKTAALADAGGAVRASSFPDDDGATALARIALDLLAASASLRPAGAPAVGRVEAAFADGSLFAVREGEGVIAATTVADPPSALVLYDLRTALRRAAEANTETAKPKPRRRAKAKAPEPDAEPAPEGGGDAAS
jgi:hypothetical protein